MTTDNIYLSDQWRNNSDPDKRSQSTNSENVENIERVLFVYGPTNIKKIERHVKPLAEVVEATTLACTQTDPDTKGFRQISPPSTGVRLLDIFLLSILTAVESIRGDYDAVVSVSLFPHGCLGLLAARWNKIPVHLGIIGCDIDVHARAWYGRAVRWLIRRFDAVTVPGPTHRRRLHQSVGVPSDRTAILANPIDVEEFFQRDDVERSYDLLWVGRLTDEKQPLLFIDVVAAVVERHPSIRAAILGDGPLATEVNKRITYHGLEEVIETPGWVDNPIPWYLNTAVFVLTSERDALPLTLIEAMSGGTVPVAPAVGNVDDLLVDDWNGRIVDPATVDGFTAAIGELLVDPEHRAQLSRNARGVRDRFTATNAAEDWKHVTQILGRASGE